MTGAVDDDPSGISTYSVAGASYGYATLWTALLSFPLMAIQLMWTRNGHRVRIGQRNPVSLSAMRFVVCLFAGHSRQRVQHWRRSWGMADAKQMMTGVHRYFWTPFFAALVMGLLLSTSYRTIAKVFKWLTMVLFAYLTAFLAHPNWPAVLRATFIPHIDWTKEYFAVLVGILGTTISPYLFFWQAAQEVEEDRDHGKITEAQRRGSTNKELRTARTDVITGMLLSNVAKHFSLIEGQEWPNG